MIMTRVLSVLLLLLFVPLSAAAQQGPVSIGLMAELTGPLAEMGDDCRKGYEVSMALFAPEDRAGDADVQMALADNEGAAAAGVREFRQLIDIMQSQVVITTRSPVGLAILPLAKQHGIPVLGIVGHPAFLKDNDIAFRIFPSGTAEGGALAEEAKKVGAKTAAVVTAEDEYFISISQGFTEKFKAAGGSLVSEESLAPDENDVSTIVTKVLKTKPDLVLVNLNPAQAGMFVKKLREQKFPGTVFGNFLIGTPEARKHAGDDLKGAAWVEVDYDRAKFMSQMDAMFGARRSSPIGYACHVALAAALQAIAKAGKGADSAAIKAELSKMTEVSLPDGPIKLNHREASLPLRIKRLEEASTEPNS